MSTSTGQPSLRLWTYPGNPRANKALIAAEYVGAHIDVPTAFKMGETNKTPEFLAINPLGKVPALETPQGGVFESNSIARYVARLNPSAHLMGGNNIQQAQVDQWMDFTSNEVEPVAYLWLSPLFGYCQFNPKVLAEAKTAAQRFLGVLNEHFLNETYLVGHHVTLADIVLTCALHGFYTRVFAPEFIAPYSNVTRWFLTMVHQPQVSKILGNVELAKVEQSAAPAGGKKEKGGDKAAAAAPKVSPKKAAPKAEKKEEDAEDVEAQIAAEAKKKPKSKLDSLPETKMDLDTVKRAAFSTRPFNTKFFDELQTMWDPAGWSWWTAHYKYNNENQVLYMTGNLIGGFIQRCDAVRKYSMGVLNITGNEDEETPPFPVSGAFLFRGLEIPEEMLLDNPDSEYYTWTKVDFSGERIEQIKQFFMADKLDGVPVLDRRYFK